MLWVIFFPFLCLLYTFNKQLLEHLTIITIYGRPTHGIATKQIVYIVYIVPYLMSRAFFLERNRPFKTRATFLSSKSLRHITAHQAILEIKSTNTEISLKLFLNPSWFLTWHNSVQVHHFLDAIICQFTVVFLQHLQNLRPQTLLNLRMKCKFVQGERQCTSRSLVSCYHKHKRLCHKQIAVYFWKSKTNFCYSISASYAFLLGASVVLTVLMVLVLNLLYVANILVCFCLFVVCT